MDHSQILPNLFVASYPKTADDIGQLKVAGITHIVDLAKKVESPENGRITRTPFRETHGTRLH